jgi:hypothetical protein
MLCMYFVEMKVDPDRGLIDDRSCPLPSRLEALILKIPSSQVLSLEHPQRRK